MSSFGSGTRAKGCRSKFRSEICEYAKAVNTAGDVNREARQAASFAETSSHQYKDVSTTHPLKLTRQALIYILDRRYRLAGSTECCPAG